MIPNGKNADSGLSDKEFADLMKDFGPFEPSPWVAVGVSGGADSLAAMLLLKSWLDDRDGRLLALTVDHGLRPGSRTEADFVRDLCRPLGIEHRTLTWRRGGSKGRSQAAAREARYGLLSAVCRERGILHLVLAHHLDDQVETFLLRLARGSTLIGLSAMASVRYHSDFRLLRPFLTTRATRLKATVVACGLSWVDDPSNEDPRYARIRMRRIAVQLAAKGIPPERFGGTTRRLALFRRDRETKAADLVARTVRVRPAGYAEIDRAAFFDEDETICAIALTRLLSALGGNPFGPRVERLRRFQMKLRDEMVAVATLSRVRAVRERGSILLVRENRNLPALALTAGVTLRWDNRFDVRLSVKRGSDVNRVYRVSSLGRKGWAALPREIRDCVKARVPAAARGSLPALWDDLGLLSQPNFGYTRENHPCDGTFSAKFRPERPLTEVFTLV